MVAPRQMMSGFSRFGTFVVLVAVAATTGCSSVPSAMPGMSWFGKKDEELAFATPKEPAAEIVCVWQPARGKGLNGVPTRGVGGQLMFFTRSKATPVAVEGDVRIYLFDNQGTVQEQAQPIHQFDFPAEQWSNYLAMGNLGPSYNVFIPYTRGGHKQVECTLQVQFRAKEGPMIYSDLASLTLPGVLEDNTAQRKANKAAEEAAQLTADVRANRKPSSGLKVKTIDARGKTKPTRAELASEFLEENPDVEHQLRELHSQARTNESSSGAIQQVSAEFEETTPAASVLSPEAERIERLERMLEELLRQKQQEQPVTRTAAKPIPAVSQASHADLEFLPPHQMAGTAHRWAEEVIEYTDESDLDEGWVLPVAAANEPEPLASRATHPLRMQPAEAPAEPAFESPRQATQKQQAAKPVTKRHPLSDWK